MRVQPSTPTPRQTNVTAIFRLAIGAAIIVAILVALPAKVAACSCMALTPQEALEHSEAAFVATVVGARELRPISALVGFGPTTAYHFAVEAVARGAIGPDVAIAAGGGSAACGISFEIGQRWLIFARMDGGSLATGLCDGNVGLGPDEEAPLAGLKPVDPGGAAEPAATGPVLPTALLAALGGALLLAGASVWAFGRRPGRPPSG